MIRAEELMIGDWVILYDSPRKVEIVYDYGRVQVGCIEEDCTVLEPIPLTPEILEKNGFKKAESDFLSQTWAWAEKSEKIYGRWVQITFYNKPINGVSYLTKIETCSRKGDGLNNLHSCDIESVQELQHALRICGIDLKIEL